MRWLGPFADGRWVAHCASLVRQPSQGTVIWCWSNRPGLLHSAQQNRKALHINSERQKALAAPGCNTLRLRYLLRECHFLFGIVNAVAWGQGGVCVDRVRSSGKSGRKLSLMLDHLVLPIPVWPPKTMLASDDVRLPLHQPFAILTFTIDLCFLRDKACIASPLCHFLRST